MELNYRRNPSALTAADYPPDEWNKVRRRQIVMFDIMRHAIPHRNNRCGMIINIS